LSNKNFIVRNGITVGAFDLVDEQGNLKANTLTVQSGFGDLQAHSVTADTITANNFGTIHANNITANSFGNVVANSFSYSDGTAPGYTQVIDDFSGSFNGVDTAFTLTVDGNPISPANPNQLQLYIGNVPILPSVYGKDIYNLSLFGKNLSRSNYPGYTIDGSTINFSTPPSTGMTFYGTFKTNNDGMPPFVLKYLPFEDINIMFSY
jgi:hypothetical protein